MRSALLDARSSAASDRPVVLVGEAATGRKRLAEWIHDVSNRSAGPVVKLRCSELRADARRSVREATERSEGGTLIVDLEDADAELGETIAEELSRRRPSSFGSSAWGVRVIVVEQDVVGVARRLVSDAQWIAMPPLRQRKADIPAMIWELVEDVAEEIDHDEFDVAPEVFDACESYSWPANFAEFRPAIERAVVVASRRARIELADLPPSVRAARRVAEAVTVRTLAEVEREHILRVLDQLGGRRRDAARALGLSRSTLLRRLRDLGLVRPKKRAG